MSGLADVWKPVIGVIAHGLAHGLAHGVIAMAKKQLQKGKPKKSDWRTNYGHCLHIPEDHRVPDVPGKLNKTHALSATGDSWEQAIYRRCELALDRTQCKLPLPGFSESALFLVKRVVVTWDEHRYDMFDKIPCEHPREPFLAFHGTKESNFDKILYNNFDTTLKSLDKGWFGNGAYFTTSMIYAQHYINFRGLSPNSGFQLPQKGRTVNIIAAMLKPGKTFRVVDMSKMGKPCEAGYDSHSVSVKPTDDFTPTADNDGVVDEWVIFDSRRILPRYIISIQRIQ